MKLALRYIGGRHCIVELTLTLDNGEFIERVTNMNSVVDVNLIDNLREIADELEEHNKEILKNK